MRIKYLGFIGLLLLACQPTLPVSQADSHIEKTSVNTDHLQLKLKWPQDTFKTSQINLKDIRYLRCWVKGTGIQNILWNTEGFVAVKGSSGATLKIAGVPKGQNRVVTAQAYDINQKPIPGGLLKAFYSSAAQQNQVTVLLKWRFVPIAEVIEYLLGQGSAGIANLDTQALQQWLDRLLYGSNPIGGDQYAIHPSRINPTLIAQAIQNNNQPLPDILSQLQPIYPTVASPFVWRNAQNQLAGLPITLSVNDPASLPQIGAAGAPGQTNLTGIAPGTWQAVGKLDGLNGGVSAQTEITATSQGELSFSTGTAGNPLIFSPVITQAQAQSGVLPQNLAAWWPGEGNAQEKSWGYHGTVFNGVTYAPGRLGQAFQFNGTNSYISAPVNWGNFAYHGSSLSIAAWLKPTTANAYSGIEIDNNRCWYSARMTFDNTGKYQLAIPYPTGPATCNWRAATTPAAIPLNSWTHIVGTYQNGCGKIYQNGQLVTQFCDGLGTIPPSANDQRVRIGLYDEDPLGAGKYYYNGLMDDVQIYNRALNATEIQNLYQRHTIALTGDGFAPTVGGNQVQIENFTVTPDTAATNSLRTVMPWPLGNSRSLQIKTNNLTSNSATLNPVVYIEHLQPLAAREGDTVTLIGHGFDTVTGNNSVRFGNLQATVLSATETQLTVQVPSGTISTPITVSNQFGQGTSTQKFTPILNQLVSLWDGDYHGLDRIGGQHGFMGTATAGFAAGVVNQSFNFNGGPYLDVTSRIATFSGQTTGTFGLWYKSTPNNISCQSLLYYGDKNTWNNTVELGLGPWIGGVPDESLFFAIRQGGAPLLQGYLARGEQFFADQQWHYIAWVMGTNFNKIYVDGQEQTLTYSNGTNTTGNLFFATPTTVNVFSMGLRFLMGITECGVTGQMDEIQIYNRPLSATEINTVYQASRP